MLSLRLNTETVAALGLNRAIYTWIVRNSTTNSLLVESYHIDEPRWNFNRKYIQLRLLPVISTVCTQANLKIPCSRHVVNLSACCLEVKICGAFVVKSCRWHSLFVKKVKTDTNRFFVASFRSHLLLTILTMVLTLVLFGRCTSKLTSRIKKILYVIITNVMFLFGYDCCVLFVLVHDCVYRDLDHPKRDQLCVACRKGLRYVWHLPYNTHCDLLPMFCCVLQLMGLIVKVRLLLDLIAVRRTSSRQTAGLAAHW